MMNAILKDCVSTRPMFEFALGETRFAANKFSGFNPETCDYAKGREYWQGWCLSILFAEQARTANVVNGVFIVKNHVPLFEKAALMSGLFTEDDFIKKPNKSTFIRGNFYQKQDVRKAFDGFWLHNFYIDAISESPLPHNVAAMKIMNTVKDVLVSKYRHLSEPQIH